MRAVTENEAIKERVTIDVQSVVTDGGEKQTLRQQHEGDLYVKNDTYYLKYEEIAEEGIVYHTIKLAEDNVQVMRHGANRMNMRYCAGESSASSYETAQGTFNMDVFTRNVRVKHEAEDLARKGHLVVEYDLKLNKQDVGFFQLTVQWTAM